MKRGSSQYEDCVNILKEELIPAMGCTEPIAVAYIAAVARRMLGGMPDSVVIEASGNIIKNVKSVIVPHTNHMKGIQAAAAAGIVAGDDARELEVIADVSAEQIEEIKEFLRRHSIIVRTADSNLTFDVRIHLENKTDHVTVRIVNYHTNIVYAEKNGVVTTDKPVEENTENDLTDRSFLTVETILDFADSVDIEDVRPLISAQIEYNTRISEEGLRNSYGANIGKVIRDNSNEADVIARCKSKAAAASDARMSGCEMPVVINSGSGNQGITVSIPVIEYARELNVGEEKMYRALVLANLIAIHQKTGIGRLSAYCGAVNAGAGAGCGIAYLLDGSYDAIKHTLINALAIISGIVCDGAKPSCAAKIANAVENGIVGYQMYRANQQFYGGDGIVKKGVEESIASVGKLAREGMRETDKCILQIMTDE